MLALRTSSFVAVQHLLRGDQSSSSPSSKSSSLVRVDAAVDEIINSLHRRLLLREV